MEASCSVSVRVLGGQWSDSTFFQLRFRLCLFFPGWFKGILCLDKCYDFPGIEAEGGIWRDPVSKLLLGGGGTPIKPSKLEANLEDVTFKETQGPPVPQRFHYDGVPDLSTPRTCTPFDHSPCGLFAKVAFLRLFQRQSKGSTQFLGQHPR